MTPSERPQVYTFQVASEIAEQYRVWSSVADLEVKWFKIIPFGDGTAEVLLSNDAERPGLPTSSLTTMPHPEQLGLLGDAPGDGAKNAIYGHER